jgi:hypothetical protein
MEALHATVSYTKNRHFDVHHLNFRGHDIIPTKFGHLMRHQAEHESSMGFYGVRELQMTAGSETAFSGDKTFEIPTDFTRLHKLFLRLRILNGNSGTDGDIVLKMSPYLIESVKFYIGSNELYTCGSDELLHYYGLMSSYEQLSGVLGTLTKIPSDFATATNRTADEGEYREIYADISTIFNQMHISPIALHQAGNQTIRVVVKLRTTVGELTEGSVAITNTALSVCKLECIHWNGMEDENTALIKAYKSGITLKYLDSTVHSETSKTLTGGSTVSYPMTQFVGKNVAFLIAGLRDTAWASTGSSIYRTYASSWTEATVKRSVVKITGHGSDLVPEISFEELQLKNALMLPETTMLSSLGSGFMVFPFCDSILNTLSNAVHTGGIWFKGTEQFYVNPHTTLTTYDLDIMAYSYAGVRIKGSSVDFIGK